MSIYIPIVAVVVTVALYFYALLGPFEEGMIRIAMATASAFLTLGLIIGYALS